MKIESIWRDHHNITGRKTRAISVGGQHVGYIYKDTDRGTATSYRVEVRDIAEDGFYNGPTIMLDVSVSRLFDRDRYDVLLAEGAIDPKVMKKTARAAYNECVQFAAEHVGALLTRWEKARA